MRRRIAIAAVLQAVVGLSGCTLAANQAAPAGAGAAVQGVGLRGVVHGGQNPVGGAHVYLFAAGTGGYGSASSSLLSATLTGLSDAVGAYVLSGADGSFSVSGDYTCTAGTQVYLYSLGGNTGTGTNAAAGFLAALGNCPSTKTLAVQVPSVTINEVSTAAAAVALAPFATDAVHIGSNATTQSEAGLANAFANAINMAGYAPVYGAPLTTGAGNGTVPQSKLNMLANILAACVNTTGTTASPSTSCATLFANTKESVTPKDTATAAIAMAKNPARNVANLYGLLSGISAPFVPTLSPAPSDFTITLTYTGSGVSAPEEVAIDAAGNAWVTEYATASISELSPTGAVATNDSNSSYLANADGLALLTNGSMWITTPGNGYLIDYTPPNTLGGYNLASVSRGMSSLPAVDGNGNVYTAGGTSSAWYMYFQVSGTLYYSNVSSSIPYPYATAIDSTNVAWTTSYNPASPGSMTGSAVLLASLASGSASNPQYAVLTTTGTNYTAGSGVAIDKSNNVWVSDYVTGYLVEFNNAATYQHSYSGGAGLSGVAIDGNSSVWTVNSSNQVVGFTNAGAAIGTFATGATGTLTGPAVDISGDVWVPNNTGNAVLEMMGVAMPVVQPLAAAVTGQVIGTAP